MCQFVQLLTALTVSATASSVFERELDRDDKNFCPIDGGFETGASLYKPAPGKK